MAESSSFKERYKNLNPEQKKAVDSIEGPVFVIAGPGTGKTEILTLRIANILLKTDTLPDNILALTFTEAAAGNMRRRLSHLIGSSVYRVNIETFHSFCNNIIQNYPEYFKNIIGSGNITEVESIAILEEIIEKIQLDLLRPWGDPFYHIREISKKIEELKREAVTSENYLKMVKEEEIKFKGRDDLYHEKGAHKGKMKSEWREYERQILKNQELALVYDEYQKTLHERRLYDFSDMIMETLLAIKENPDLKLSLQENNQYILVDEHQDTNNAQNKILELLIDFHKDPNIFVVGDGKQAIFRFQGASLENFEYMKKLYPKALLISLKLNYRSGQEILDAAHSLIPSPTTLLSGANKQSKIKIVDFSKKTFEDIYIAEKAKELIDAGIPPKEIAIIYRANKEAFRVAEALERSGVPYIIESDEDLLNERFVKKILIILEAISHYSEDEYLIPLLHIEEFQIEPLVAYRMIYESGNKRVPLYDYISVSKDENVVVLKDKLKSWAKHANSDHLSEFLERILRESGLLNSMLASRDAEAFLGIEKLFQEGKRISGNRPGASIKDFMEYVGIVKKRKLFIKRPKQSGKNAVRLMTAHRSKGLEFSHVFIVNATENSFGEKSKRESIKLLLSIYKMTDIKSDDNSLSDERRLFYVAMTRAKEELIITYSSQDESGNEVLPSSFILEIREDKKEIVSGKSFEENLLKTPEKLFIEPKKTGVIELDREFISELWHSYPLSVTALNNYLSCPWKYFYKNLLRIPSSQEKHQVYGTAMHGAVEDLWRSLKDRDPEKSFLLDSYERRLGLLGVLNDREYKEALKRGRESLSGWFDFAEPKLGNQILSEFSIKGVELEKDIIISGKLDKVEVVGEKRFYVTDYKTGKVKTRNYILGKTKDGGGDIKRQLVFYKLILSLYDGTHMEKGIIEFLEPNDSGKYSREEFEITDEEVNELKETIRRVSKEILSLDFWNKKCDDKDCEYCSFRKLLK